MGAGGLLAPPPPSSRPPPHESDMHCVSKSHCTQQKIWPEAGAVNDKFVTL